MGAITRPAGCGRLFWAFVKDVGIDHRRLHVFVAQEFLDGADVIAPFRQMRSETMAKGVGADRLDDARQAGRLLDRFLQAALVQVVAARDARTRVRGQGVSREDVLPAPLLVGIGIFPLQGAGQVDGAVAMGQVLLVQGFHPLQMFLEQRDEAVGHTVTPSCSPLPSRTMRARRSKSRSLTRKRRHSISRMPLP